MKQQAENSSPRAISSLDPYTRINDEFLRSELLLTTSYITRNARAMGNFTKPRSYFLIDVLNHLKKTRDRIVFKTNACREEDLAARKRKVVELFEEVKRKVRARGR